MIRLLHLFFAFYLFGNIVYGQQQGSAHPLTEVRSKMGEYVMGHEKAPIKIVMYYSLTCTHCREFDQKILPLIVDKFVNTGKVKWVVHDFPTDNVALKAAQIAWCKGASHYLKLAQNLLEHQHDWSFASDWKDKIWQLAHKQGITHKEFETGLNSKEIQDTILQHCLDAKKNHKVDFAPAFVVYTPAVKEGKLFEGDMTLEAVEKIVKSVE